MLLFLRNKFLPVQFAVFALVFNAFMQAQCCVGVLEGAAESLFEAGAAEPAHAGGHAGGHADTNSGGHVGHGSGHGSDGCDCTDGICSPSLVVLAVLQGVSVDQVQAGKASPPKAVRYTPAREFGIFSARGPPDTFL